VARLTLEEYKSIFDVNEGGQVRARYGMVMLEAKQPRLFAMNGSPSTLAADFRTMDLLALAYMVEGKFDQIAKCDHHQQAIARRVYWQLVRGILTDIRGNRMGNYWKLF